MRAFAGCAVVALVATALTASPSEAANCTRTSVGIGPLTETGSYGGFEGGLYPGGGNARPPVHTVVGETLARTTGPRNALGLPDASGKLVLLTVGMSNTRQESAALSPRANADPLKHPSVVVVNGAKGGVDATDMSDPTSSYWTSHVPAQLANSGVTAAQVQTVWLKQALRAPSAGFPAEAERLESRLRAIAQILKVSFVNLRLVYLSSRIYAGYASTMLNPEPYAYESAFSVKWLVESQIDGTYPLADPSSGVVAPWLSWGPYLWADGLTPRADGLTWSCSEFAADGTHPNGAGSAKVADQILDFFHTDSTAQIWYEAGGSATPV